jgi:uncharacterized repeat protein (TIGR03843 family)
MATDADLANALSTSPLEVVGRLVDSSNNALVVNVDTTAREGETVAVYKPAAGERPLWDFPDATLARREVAAYLLSQELGWDHVPMTVWRQDGPNGPGMIQRWIDGEVADEFINLFEPHAVPTGWLPILEGRDANNHPVVLAHHDNEQLERIALFDFIANNADRKGGHLIAEQAGSGQHVWAIDHGICFHIEPKLRTVIWGFVDRQLPESLLTDIQRLIRSFDQFRSLVDSHLSSAEIDAVLARARELVELGTFPAPSGQGPAVPWPIF